MGIEALVGGIALSGLAGSAMNAGAQASANETNARLQAATNKMNEALTRESWAREDNAVQRRRADMLAAGINPNLAAGNPAQTSGAAQMGAARVNPVNYGDMFKSVGSSLAAAPSIQAAIAQRDLTKAATVTELEKPEAARAAASRDMAAAAKNYAEAGYKIQSTRIMRKDADLWVNQGVDVRDRDAISKVMKQFPDFKDRLSGGRSLTDEEIRRRWAEIEPEARVEAARGNKDAQRMLQKFGSGR